MDFWIFFLKEKVKRQNEKPNAKTRRKDEEGSGTEAGCGGEHLRGVPVQRGHAEGHCPPIERLLRDEVPDAAALHHAVGDR